MCTPLYWTKPIEGDWCPDIPPEEVEQIVEIQEQGYKELYRAENS